MTSYNVSIRHFNYTEHMQRGMKSITNARALARSASRENPRALVYVTMSAWHCSQVLETFMGGRSTTANDGQ